MTNDDHRFQQALWALSANIRLRAGEQGLTIAEIAERSSMHRTHLYDIMAGRKRVRLDVLARIADTLDVDVWELLRPVSD